MHNIQEQYAVNGAFKRITITSFDTRFAVEDGCDAYSIVDVQVPQPPDNIKKFLEGDNSVEIYPVASDVSKLCNYALASFPNIQTIYLFKTDDLVELNDNSFGGLDNLDSVYVPESLYSSYQEAYPEFAELFKKLVTTYVWTIPNGSSSTLSALEMNGFVNLLSSAQKNAIGRIEIPSSYTDYEYGSTNRLFDGTFSVLEYVDLLNNILYLENVNTVLQTGYKLEVE